MTETHKSHACCFEQGENPACGLKGIHRCCLCEKEVPDAKPEWQEKIRTICSYHTDDGTSGYCLLEKQFEAGFEINPVNSNHCETCIQNIQSCEHLCSGNCRRVGCNCDCGEYHEGS